jgi:hypothetical protein
MQNCDIRIGNAYMFRAIICLLIKIGSPLNSQTTNRLVDKTLLWVKRPVGVKTVSQMWNSLSRHHHYLVRYKAMCLVTVSYHLFLTGLHAACSVLAFSSSPFFPQVVGFEVRTAEVMKSSVFWDITPRSPLKVNWRFGGTYRLHFQGRRMSQARNQQV